MTETAREQANRILKEGVDLDFAKEQKEWCSNRLMVLENTSSELKFSERVWGKVIEELQDAKKHGKN